MFNSKYTEALPIPLLGTATGEKDSGIEKPAVKRVKYGYNI